MNARKIAAALKHTGNIQAAASRLGVTRQGLYAWLDRNGYVVKRRAYLAKRQAK